MSFDLRSPLPFRSTRLALAGLAALLLCSFATPRIAAAAGTGDCTQPAASAGADSAVALASVAAKVPASDGCQFIRDAISERAAGGGGVVTIPPGEYTCATAIVLDHDGIELRGMGRERTTLRLADHANAPVIVMGDLHTPPRPVHRISVRDLTIDGNKDKQDNECWGGACDAGGLAFIRNNGITVRGVHDGVIERVHTHSARSGGVVTERGTWRLRIRDFESSNHFFDGFAGYQTYDSDLSGMYLHDNHGAAVSLDIDFSRNRVHHCRFRDNRDVSIFGRDIRDNSFEDITIRRNGSSLYVFLAVASGSETCPERNRFVRVDIEGHGDAGFWLNEAQCRGNTVVDSRVSIGKPGACMHSPEGALGAENVRCE